MQSHSEGKHLVKLLPFDESQLWNRTYVNKKHTTDMEGNYIDKRERKIKGEDTMTLRK